MIRVLALATLLLPVILGSFPGLHVHDTASSRADLPAAADTVDSGNDCPLCALSRVPAHSVACEPGDSGPGRSGTGATTLPDLPCSSPVIAEAAPRAPPVHDSTWNT